MTHATIIDLAERRRDRQWERMREQYRRQLEASLRRLRDMGRPMVISDEPPGDGPEAA